MTKLVDWIKRHLVAAAFSVVTFPISWGLGCSYGVVENGSAEGLGRMTDSVQRGLSRVRSQRKDRYLYIPVFRLAGGEAASHIVTGSLDGGIHATERRLDADVVLAGPTTFINPDAEIGNLLGREP